MVGKRRLNQFLRRSARSVMPLRSAGVDESPFWGKAGAGWLDVKAVNLSDLNQKAVNQERSAVSSMGRRSDCQRRRAPPTRNARSASQTPAAGERRPWRANETPIREIE